MPRLARVKMETGGAYYHVYSRTAGLKGEFPLDSKLCRQKMIDLVEYSEQEVHEAIATCPADCITWEEA